MNTDSIIIAIIAAAPGLVALIGTLRKDAAAAKKTTSEREQLEEEITEQVLARAKTENIDLNQRIAALGAELSKERVERKQEGESLRAKSNEQQRTINSQRDQIAELIKQVDDKNRIIELQQHTIDELKARVDKLSVRLSHYEAAGQV